MLTTDIKEKQNKKPEKVVDRRFEDPRFKAAVRTVLEWFDLESNMGNFRMVESRLVKIDWIAWSDNISSNHPEPDFIPIEKFYGSCKEILK